MKFIKADRDRFTFFIEDHERQMLFRVIKLYPLVPVAHHQRSKSANKTEDQQLLEEALSEQRSKNKKQVLSWLRSRSKFRETEHGYVFVLETGQMEWLLQVLNDVHVGSWLLLGSPDGPAEIFKNLNRNTAPHFWAMEVAHGFLRVLVRVLDER